MGRTYRRRRGDTLQPGRFTPEVVRALRMKSREFDGQYQQEPTPATGRIFNPNWWRLYKDLPECELIVLSVDCSFKSKSTSDFVAIHKWGTLGVRSYLIERRTERMGYIQTKAAIKDMQSRGRPASVILIESAANGVAVIEELQADPDFGASVISIEPQGDKITRANAASADVEAGSIYLPEGAEWLTTFLRTFAAFPGVKNDDDVDAASQFINWRRTRNLAYGVLDLARQYKSGERPLPPSVDEKLALAIRRVDNRALQLQKIEKQKPNCPECQQSKTVWEGAPVEGGYWCRQCGVSFDAAGKLTSEPGREIIGVTCCPDAMEVFAKTGKPHVQVIGSERRCVPCGKQTGRDARNPEPRGVSRAEYAKGVGRLRGQFALDADIGYGAGISFKNIFGRFG
jgi:predicted phage terminase large subunit-like protein